jgi:hypothetical protein
MNSLSLNGLKKVTVVALATTELIWSLGVRADQIRIVDSGGLVRAIKVTRAVAKVIVTIQSPQPQIIKGECIANNVDGLAAEKRVAISAKGECVFSEVSGGSWQITVSGGVNWQVRIYE